mgnify:CR=1 FL=1
MKLIIVMFALFSTMVLAESSSLNLSLPSSPSSYQSDRVRAGDTECQAAIGSSTNVEFGVVGVMNQNDPLDYRTNGTIDPTYRDEMLKDVGVYAKIVIPIGAPTKRLNCDLLYQLELEKKRLEVMKLRQEIQNLQNLNFEN